MTVVKKISPDLTLEKDLTEFEVKDRGIDPCPVCGDKKVFKTKAYYIVGDPVAVCVSHKGLALRTSHKLWNELDSLKTKKQVDAKAKELWKKLENPNTRWCALFRLGKNLSRKWKKNGEALHKRLLSIK